MLGLNTIPELFVVERGLRDLVGIIPDGERGELIHATDAVRDGQESIGGQVSALYGLLKERAPKYRVDHRPRFLTPEDLVARTERCLTAAQNKEEVDECDAGQLFIAPTGCVEAWKQLVLADKSGAIQNGVRGASAVDDGQFCDLEYCRALQPAFEKTGTFLKRDELSTDDDTLIRRAMCSANVSTQDRNAARDILRNELAAQVSVMRKNGFLPHRASAIQTMPSFRQYGIRPFIACFGPNAEELVSEYSNEDPELSMFVDDLFKEKSHYNRLALGYSYAHLDKDFLRKLETVPDDKLADFLHSLDENSPLDSHRLGERFNPQTARMLIHFNSRHGLPCLPRRLWYTYAKDSCEKLMAVSHDKFDVCDEFGLTELNKVKVSRNYDGDEGVAALMRKFFNAGIGPSYFAPYADSLLIERELRVAQDWIYGLVSMERRSINPRPKNPGEACRPILDTITDSTIDRIAALQFLEDEGMSYEALTPLQRRGIKPEKVAHRLKRYNEGEVDPRVIRKSHVSIRQAGKLDAHIQGLIDDTENKKRDAEELTVFLAERGLELPEYFARFARNFTPTRILKMIRYIESCGVTFTGEGQWSWINLGPDNLNRKIGKEFLRVNDEANWKQLAYAYGLTKIPKTISSRPAWSAWRYLYSAKLAGLEPDEIAIGQTHMLPLHGEWRVHIRKAIERKAESDVRLNDMNKLALRKHKLADAIAAKIRFVDAEVLFEHLGIEDCDRLERMLDEDDNGGLINELNLLEADFHIREEVIKRLINSGMPLPDIEYFVECFSADELKERVDVFDAHHMRIDPELFIQSVADIRSAIAPVPE